MAYKCIYSKTKGSGTLSKTKFTLKNGEKNKTLANKLNNHVIKKFKKGEKALASMDNNSSVDLADMKLLSKLKHRN